MLTTTLQEAEEGAKHFSALNQTLMAKNAQLITDNQILQEQNDILLRERAIQKRQKEKQARKEPNSPRKGDRQAPMQLTPDVSPRLAGPPLTPRTLAKVKATIRQCSKTRDYERELKMRAEISRLRDLCNKQKRELLILKATDGRRVELEILLKQCLLDVKARLAGKRKSSTASLQWLGWTACTASNPKIVSCERCQICFAQSTSSFDPKTSRERTTGDAPKDCEATPVV
ncbi:uncharacterized protein LOC34618431 [Cyclospora cayetanensis]|uniref:Uncharacterized protein LOC34618431 n=1 Tax=Cyclospora cayetanensis TaxID=88456 RepID=A0A6P6RX48_9EIME|nr:uncharacterized protein LOC34618431 [Cyclospora cayetanensis]